MQNRRRMLITGATEGVGKATAAGLAAQGHHVIIHGRDKDKLARTAAELKALGTGGEVDVVCADFSSLASVETMAKTILERYSDLDVLINNAACMTPERRLSADGFELMLAVNHLAPFLLTESLLPVFKNRGKGRIVILSSVGYKSAKPDLADIGAEKNFKMQLQYFNTKLYNLYHALDLAERFAGTDVTVNAVHPGGVRTQLARDFKGFMKVMFDIMMPLFFISPEDGAKTSIFAATSAEIEKVTGCYFTKCRPEALTRLGSDADLRAKVLAVTKTLAMPNGPDLSRPAC